MARWHVTGAGRDPEARNIDGRAAMKQAAEAHQLVEQQWPGSGFAVERRGDEAGDSVIADVTVPADDAFDAQRLARWVFDHALPTVTFTEMNAVPVGDTGGTPSPAIACSFCGRTQRQVEKLIAGPGVYICDECVAFMVEIMREEFPGWPPE